MNTEQILKKSPFIGQVGHIKFYEHPTMGEDAPLMAFDTFSGKLTIRSDHYELPDISEI